jgi:gas vesicle protein
MASCNPASPKGAILPSLGLPGRAKVASILLSRSVTREALMNEHTPDCASHGTSYSALTFSFLAGGLAGATVALLLAPQSGKVTRQIMRRKLNDTADSARDLKGRVADKLSDAADSARALKDRAVRRGQEAREEATYRMEGAASALAGKDEQ